MLYLRQTAIRWLHFVPIFIRLGADQNNHSNTLLTCSNVYMLMSLCSAVIALLLPSFALHILTMAAPPSGLWGWGSAASIDSAAGDVVAEVEIISSADSEEDFQDGAMWNELRLMKREAKAEAAGTTDHEQRDDAVYHPDACQPIAEPHAEPASKRLKRIDHRYMVEVAVDLVADEENSARAREYQGMSYEDRRWEQSSGFTIHASSSSSSEAVQAFESYPDNVSLAGDIEWEHEQMLLMENEDWNVLNASIPGGFARRVYYQGDYGDSC